MATFCRSLLEKWNGSAEFDENIVNKSCEYVVVWTLIEKDLHTNACLCQWIAISNGNQIYSSSDDDAIVAYYKQ